MKPRDRGPTGERERRPPQEGALERLTTLGRALARRRFEHARFSPEEFPALTVRLLRASPQPWDRAAAVLVWSQRRPEAFLRCASHFMDDASPHVRAAVMEGLCNVGLLSEGGPASSAIRRLLQQGISDSDAEVRSAAEEGIAVLDVPAEEEPVRGPALVSSATDRWQAVRRGFLELLLPDLRFTIGTLLERVDAGAPLMTAKPTFGLGFSPGEIERELLVLFTELAPQADSAAVAVLQLIPDPDAARGALDALRREGPIRERVAAVEEILGRHGRGAVDVWSALADAVASAARRGEPADVDPSV